MPIWIVASNTLRQTLRQRLYLNIAVFGLGMVMLAMTIGQLTFGYPDRVVRSIGLSGVTVAVDLMALMVAVTLVHSEIDKKTLFVVLTRPIHRWEYMVGRYFGLLAAIVLALGGFAIVFVLTLYAARGAPTNTDVVALFSVLPEAAVLGAFGVLLSSFSTPALSTGMGLGFWVAAASTDDLLRLTEKADALTRLIVKVVYYGLPSLARFNFREHAVYALPVTLSELATAVAYGLCYAMFLVAVASLILSRREMV